jgi:hypothetical protein
MKLQFAHENWKKFNNQIQIYMKLIIKSVLPDLLLVIHT